MSDRNQNVVAATGRVGDVGEQERAPLVLGKPALELPAHQGGGSANGYRQDVWSASHYDRPIAGLTTRAINASSARRAIFLPPP
jgi:hypothetical protein